MLKLSNRGRYAVQALFDLAFFGRGGGEDEPTDEAPPAQVRDVAGRQRIPVRFLEQILQELKRAGLVESKRGPRGGFRLARSPEDVRLGDVLRAVDGPVALASRPPERVRDRIGATAAKAPDMRAVTDAFLTDLGRSVERCFDEVTLRDLCLRGEELGLRGAGRTNGATGPIAARWVI